MKYYVAGIQSGRHSSSSAKDNQRRSAAKEWRDMTPGDDSSQTEGESESSSFLQIEQQQKLFCFPFN